MNPQQNDYEYGTFALITVLLHMGCPDILRSEGMTYRLEVTTHETGLPGRQKKSFFFPFTSAVANVVGLLQVKHSIVSSGYLAHENNESISLSQAEPT